MKLSSFLFLFFLGVISDSIASGIGGYVTIRTNGHGHMRRLGYMLIGLCIATLSQLVAVSFGYVVKPHFTTGYAWAFWIGRAIQSLTLWAFVLHLLVPKPGLIEFITRVPRRVRDFLKKKG